MRRFRLLWKVSIVNFGMEFPSVAETHLNLLPHTLFIGFWNETKVFKQPEVVGVANLEEFPAIVDHGVVHFAANGTFLRQGWILAVEEVEVVVEGVHCKFWDGVSQCCRNTFESIASHHDPRTLE